MVSRDSLDRPDGKWRDPHNCDHLERQVRIWDGWSNPDDIMQTRLYSAVVEECQSQH